MELPQKYIEVKDFDVSDHFFDKLQNIGIETAVAISRSISRSKITLPDNDTIAYTIGGIAQTDYEDIPFSVRFIKIEPDTVLLADINFISMDEYLDLINLNLYIKDYDKHSTSKTTKGNNQQYL